MQDVVSDGSEVSGWDVVQSALCTTPRGYEFRKSFNLSDVNIRDKNDRKLKGVTS